MTMAEKLRIMEELWNDLRMRADGVPMPQWHKDLLDERQRLIETGEAQFDDWETAKKRIIEQTS
jgi:Putative addiction module component